MSTHLARVETTPESRSDFDICWTVTLLQLATRDVPEHIQRRLTDISNVHTATKLTVHILTEKKIQWGMLEEWSKQHTQYAPHTSRIVLLTLLSPNILTIFSQYTC